MLSAWCMASSHACSSAAMSTDGSPESEPSPARALASKTSPVPEGSWLDGASGAPSWPWRLRVLTVTVFVSTLCCPRRHRRRLRPDRRRHRRDRTDRRIHRRRRREAAGCPRRRLGVRCRRHRNLRPWGPAGGRRPARRFCHYICAEPRWNGHESPFSSMLRTIRSLPTGHSHPCPAPGLLPGVEYRVELRGWMDILPAWNPSPPNVPPSSGPT